MIIIVTKDQAFIQYVLNQNTASWGNIYVIPNNLSQNQATQMITHLVGQLGMNEALCFVGHGNDIEMGGTGLGNDTWVWNRQALAAIIEQFIPNNWSYNLILFQICCESVANYSAGVAVDLGNLNKHDIWCFGYNKSILISATIPSVQQVTTNVALQGTIS